MHSDPVIVARERPDRADVLALLDEHLTDMFATSPAESVHALDHTALLDPRITFFTARDDGGALLGCGALSVLGPDDGEIKSMRTSAAARGRGVAGSVLLAILAEARENGLTRIWLETGAEDYFAAARRLYVRNGFTECGPFGSYVEDPHSVFMTLELSTDSTDSTDSTAPNAPNA
ncbi:GNAT family N-acetyltransferase [Labedella populi]|uniref:GNAT family N-acetyltransferase n=1 Tax=Labedella populi TaxID=2498850 RepID=A0A3S4A6N2_9MICO|nr:GNAT family N-acetyltransferase [Labedella populi]RWZ61583.1 GNAT family N-acetyltransferase [Labedella populi]